MWYNYISDYMELLSVFDKEENLLDKKIIRGIEPTGNEYTMITYIFIVNNNNEILLEKNSKTGKWVIPGGHVISGNPILDVKRECMEELSININNEIKVIDTLSNNNRFFKLFIVRENININDVVVQKEEVIDAKYFSLDDIDKLINDNEFRENNIIFIETYKKYLLS